MGYNALEIYLYFKIYHAIDVNLLEFKPNRLRYIISLRILTFQRGVSSLV